MTYPLNEKGRPDRQGDPSVPNTSAADGIAPLTYSEVVELADLRKRAGLDRTRRTLLDLQVGDRFWHFDEHLGVLWAGPIEETPLMSAQFCKQLAVIPVDGGPSRILHASPEVRLAGPVAVATPQLAEAARAYWSTLPARERAELAELRAQVLT